MYCTWCEMKINPEIAWSNLFWSEAKDYLCLSCSKGLYKIGNTHCPKCYKPDITNVCADCVEWKKEDNDVISKNISVYAYNEQMKEMIAKWKYRGDYELGFAFKKDFCNKFSKTFQKEFKSYAIMPIPLSEEREKERCFNQATMLADFLGVKVTQSLSRIHTEKQSKKTRSERMLGKNPFVLHESINKPVILIDDIYTTGTTLRHAATLLKSNGTPEVFSLTLIRG